LGQGQMRKQHWVKVTAGDRIRSMSQQETGLGQGHMRRQHWVKVIGEGDRIGSRSHEKETTLGEGHRRKRQDWVKVT